MTPVLVRKLGRSAAKIKKSSGDNEQPCGRPILLIKAFDNWLPDLMKN